MSKTSLRDKEVKNFYYYSRGSLYESKTSLTKAFNRKLIQEEDFGYFNKEINKIGVKLNNYINSIGKKTQSMTPVKYAHTSHFTGQAEN